MLTYKCKYIDTKMTENPNLPIPQDVSASDASVAHELGTLGDDGATARDAGFLVVGNEVVDPDHTIRGAEAVMPGGGLEMGQSQDGVDESIGASNTSQQRKAHTRGSAILRLLRPDIAKTPPYVYSSKRAERRGDKSARANSENVVDAHIQRLEQAAERLGTKRFIEASVETLVTDKKDIPDRYYELQQQIMRDNGEFFDIVNNEAVRDNLADMVRDVQRSGLETWATELGEGDYPSWFVVYAWDGLSKMGNFNAKSQTYAKRSSGTTAPYPRVNSEALRAVYEAISQFSAGHALEDDKLSSLVQGGNFNRIYSHEMLKHRVIVNTPESAEYVHGQWREYGPDDAEALMKASDGTTWCTAGEAHASMYLGREDARFYIFHLSDEAGRTSDSGSVSVRMESGRVAEVSGLAGGGRQYIEEALVPTAFDKVAELPGGDRFIMAQRDKDILMNADRKFAAGEKLSIEELETIYEVERPIEYTIEDSRVMDQRLHDFRRKVDRHTEQLAEKYGVDAQWMTAQVTDLNRILPDLLSQGANADGITKKLSRKINRLEYRTSAARTQQSLMQNNMYRVGVLQKHFPALVRAGLSIDMASQVVEDTGSISESMIGSALDAGVRGKAILDKVSERDGAMLVPYVAKLIAAGLKPEEVAKRMVSEYGELFVHRKPASPNQFDFELIETNPIEALAMAGCDMKAFARRLNDFSRKEYSDDLAKVGVSLRPRRRLRGFFARNR